MTSAPNTTRRERIEEDGRHDVAIGGMKPIISLSTDASLCIVISLDRNDHTAFSLLNA
jgi:hypothetical protein